MRSSALEGPRCNWQFFRAMEKAEQVEHQTSQHLSRAAQFDLLYMLMLGRWNREKESKMAVAKRQGRSKEGPRTRVKTSGRTNRTNSTPG